jgi:signal transduction histidine kinase
MLLPRASIETTNLSEISEGRLPDTQATIVDAGPVARGAIEALHVLRARGFRGAILVVTAKPDDSALLQTIEALGATSISRARAEAAPFELGSALATAMDDGSVVSTELATARRVFAAGHVALSLQHAINNPLAALMAEAQLLQLEENLTNEQRSSIDRMVELCRRVVALVRRLDALGDNGSDGAHDSASE